MNYIDENIDRLSYINKNIPFSILSDVDKMSNGMFQKELTQIYNYYLVYEKGAEFSFDDLNGGYIPSDLKYKKTRTIVNKEARFMFSNPPSIEISGNEYVNQTEEEKEKLESLDAYIKKVLKDNSFNKNLLKAEKDCQIGKRVCVVVNINDKALSVDMLSSKNFYYEFKDGQLEKLVLFYLLVDSTVTTSRIYLKKYYTLEDGKLLIKEQRINGAGKVLEEEEFNDTGLEFIPAKIVFNDGLLNDEVGSSTIQDLIDYEEMYTKLANTDSDAQRKSMSPVAYTIDASEGSTKNLKTGPGAYWDIQSDENGVDQKSASVGLLEPNMAYSSSLDTTLNRIKSSMYEEVSMPDVTSDKLAGIMTSGKAMKAIYWDLTVRCDEKMLEWIPAIEFVINCLYEFNLKFPNTIKKLGYEQLSEVEFIVKVERNYAILEDETEEKEMDLQEVLNKTMSRKSYMKKWRNLSDAKSEEELIQIAKEREILEDTSYFQ